MQVKNRFPITFQSIFGILLAIALLLAGCDNKNPSSVYNENASYADDPVIQSIDPPDSAIAGIDLVTINGQNFANSDTANMVYFNGVQATVVSASSNQLVVSIQHVPEVAGDSTNILVDVDGSLDFARFKYTVRLAVKPAIADFSPTDELFGIAANSQNEVYASVGGYVIKLFDNQGQLKNAFNWSPPIAAQFKSIVYGPEARLYSGGRIVRTTYVFGISLTPDTTYTTNLASVSEIPQDLDFDQNHNLWVALVSNIIQIKDVTTDNPTSNELVSFDDRALIALRYFQDKLYLLSKDDATEQYGLWECDTTSGTTTEIVNLSNAYGDTLVAYDIEIDEQGDIFVTTNLDNSILRVSGAQQTVEEYYPGLVPTPLKSLIWNNGSYLYAAGVNPEDGSPAIYQIDTKTLHGAPRWGRN